MFRGYMKKEGRWKEARREGWEKEWREKGVCD